MWIRKYLSVVLLGLCASGGRGSGGCDQFGAARAATPAANPGVQAALNRSIYWSSIQGLGNGFLFLVLVVSSLLAEIDRPQIRTCRALVPDRRGFLLVRTHALRADPLGRAAGLCGRLAGRRAYRVLGSVVERRPGCLAHFHIHRRPLPHGRGSEAQHAHFRGRTLSGSSAILTMSRGATVVLPGVCGTPVGAINKSPASNGCSVTPLNLPDTLGPLTALVE